MAKKSPEQEYLEKTVGILHAFFVDVQATLREGKNPLQKYRERIMNMLLDFQYNGCSDAEVLAVTSSATEPLPHKGRDTEPLTHESGAYLRVHYVIQSGGMIFDPLYIGKEPLPLEQYAKRVFAGSDVCLWRETTQDNYTTLVHGPRRKAA